MRRSDVIKITPIVKAPPSPEDRECIRLMKRIANSPEFLKELEEKTAKAIAHHLLTGEWPE